MPTYNVSVTRLSYYTVEAECAEEAVDTALNGDLEPDNIETVDHTVDEIDTSEAD